jgi:DNA-binding NtrC family response regulator
MRAPRVLVVEGDAGSRRLVSESLHSEGAEVFVATSADEGLARLKQEPLDALFVSLRLPGGDGFDVVREARRQRPSPLVVVMSAQASLQSAIDAMHLGVLDYLTMPLTSKQISLAFARVSAALNGVKQTACDPATNRRADKVPFRIVAASPAMRELVALAGRVAQADMPLLIQGETGVGKESTARAIHAAAKRSDGPFLRIACAAMRNDQLEAMLFGQQTGGQHCRGLLEEAAGGFAYFHGVCELPRWIQGRLAETIDQGWFVPIGSNRQVPLEARIVAATAHDVHRALDEGLLLHSLYYQLNVIPIVVPPLRQRREDIAPLATHFLAQLSSSASCGKLSKNLRFSKQALDLMLHYDWPGNVRELANVVRRAALFARGDEVSAVELSDLAGPKERRPEEDDSLIRILAGDLKTMERHIIGEAIKTCKGNKAAAARMLGLHRRTLYRILQNANHTKSALIN